MSDAAEQRADAGPEGAEAARPALLARLRRSPDLAAVLAILVPGAGHLYLGRVRAAVGWLAAILVGYWAVFFPGLVLHLFSIRAAYRAASPRPSEDGEQARPRA